MFNQRQLFYACSISFAYVAILTIAGQLLIVCMILQKRRECEHNLIQSAYKVKKSAAY